MTRLPRSRPVFLLLLMAMASAGPSTLAAPAPAQSIDRHHFDIPAQDLGNALTLFGQQAEREVVFAADITRGKRSAAVHGDLTTKEALDKLLAGSGLMYRLNETGPVVVEIASALLEKPDMNAPNGTDGPTLTKAAQLAELVVTGSHLKHGNATNIVTSVDRSDFENQGLTTAEDVARSLPQNFSSRNSGASEVGQNAVATGNPGAQRGASSVDLGGMGEGATLVLVDGHRLASSPSVGSTYVDISTIPLDAVQRVEVLTGGASAVYGSDAVAGVVNFVLRHDFTGAESKVSYSVNKNGGSDLILSQFVGAAWSSGSIMGDVTYRRSEPVVTSDVLTSQNFTAVGGRDFRNATAGQPGFFTPVGGGTFTTIPGVSQVTFPAGQNGTAVTLADAINISNPASAPRSNLLQPYLTPDETQWSGYLAAEERLDERWKLFADALYSRRESKDFDPAATIGQGLLLPGINPFNPFKEPVYVNYIFAGETADARMPVPHNSVVSDRLQFTTGATADISGDWRATMSVGYGRADESDQEQSVLENSTDPTAVPVFAALNNPNPAQALNVFGNGSTNSASALSGLLSTLTTDYIDTLWSADAQLSGTAFRVRGQPMDMVVGAEARRETLRADDVVFVNSVPQLELTSRSQKLTAAFVEFDLPVVTDTDGLPLINRLEFSSAGRYERYAFDAQQSQALAADLHRFTPSAGVLWKPAPAFAVRANWSKVYKIPGLNDLFRPTLNLVLPYFPDPLSPTGLATNVHYIYGGNPSLREQSGESTTVGVEFAPLEVPSLRLRAVYSEIVFKNLITDPFTIFNLSQVLANPNEFPGTSVRSAGGALLQVSEVPVNLAERSRRALDLSARYSHSLAKGELSLQLDATRTLSLDVTVTPGSVPQPIAGTINGPSAWQLRATSGYQLGPAFATLVWNYGSGYLNTDPTAVTTRIASYAPADLIGGYRFDANRISLTLGVYNVFDAAFPFVDNAFGYDARRVDVRGRRALIAIKADF